MDNKNETFHNKRNTLASVSFYQMYVDSPRSSTKDEKDLVKSMNEKKYRLKLVGNMSSRIITHYHYLGLINDNRIKGKGWRLFSFTELVWLKIIVRLRNFGFDLNKIKKVKEFLEIQGEKIKASDYPKLDFYILLSLRDSDPVKLLVFDSGEALLGNQLEIDISKQFQTIQDDYISIDLNKLVGEIIKDESIKTDYLDYTLTNVEKEIKETLQLENLNSVSLKAINGDEYLMDKEFIMSSEIEMNILLNKLKYAESTTNKRGGKSFHKLIEKKKIKKH